MADYKMEIMPEPEEGQIALLKLEKKVQHSIIKGLVKGRNYMMVKLFSCLFLSLFLWSTCISSNAEVGSKRNQLLLKAIQSKDYDLRCRAIDELSGCIETEPNAQRILVERLFSKKDDLEQVVIIETLSTGDTNTVNLLMKQMKGYSNSPEKFEKGLFVLGRMGKRAETAQKFLLDAFKQFDKDTQTQGAIRTVLANIGYNVKDATMLISKDIANRNELAFGEIQMLSLIKADSWVTENIVNQMVAWLSENPEMPQSDMLAVGLGAIGGKAKNAGSVLTKLARSSCSEQDVQPRSIWLTFALLRVDPNSNPDLTKCALKCLARNSPGYTPIVTKYWVSDILIGTDPNILKKLLPMLQDKDAGVVSGALRMFEALGTKAQPYSQHIFKTLREYPKEEIRSLAAETLSFVAAPDQIAQLEDALKSEKDESVQDELRKSIRIVSLEE